MTAPAILTEETLGLLSLGRNLFYRPCGRLLKLSANSVPIQARPHGINHSTPANHPVPGLPLSPASLTLRASVPLSL